MHLFNKSIFKIIFLFIALILLILCSYYAKNFKLDASSDTLILQNDKDFEFFNYSSLINYGWP